VKRLPLPDAVDVWDQAGAAERQSLNRIIFPKVLSWPKSASRTEREQMQQQLGREEEDITFVAGLPDQIDNKTVSILRARAKSQPALIPAAPADTSV
jgi:hypothetical protein